MKVFVTGGTGFVGTHFLSHALAAGHEVSALRRPGSRTRLPLIQEPRWLNGGMDQDWQAELAGQDVWVHLAAHTANPPYADLAVCLHWNLTVPLVLAEQARRAGVGRFVVAGSFFEYGQVPADMDAVSEDAPLAPNNAYATSKAAASIAFMGWARQEGLRLRLMRIFHVFGPGEPSTRFWPSLQRAALSGADFPMSAGEQVRDFVPVELVAQRLVEGLDLDDVQPGTPVIEHIGSGRAQTLLDFAQHWWQEWGAAGCLRPGERPYREGEIMRLVPRSTRGG